MSPVISADGLAVHFPGCEALRGVDLSVSSGTVSALLGENGAGKTTLIRVLTGFQIPSAGNCTVLGLNPIKEARQIRQRVGYVSDAPALYEWMRVDEIGWFASSFYEQGFLQNYNSAIARYEVPANRKIKHLSKGQRAKVALALALAHDPELLILDEPTSGLDPLVRREFLESMLDRVATGRTVLLSSHQISEVERVADEVAILHGGRCRVQEPLQDLREAVSELILSLDDPLVAIPDVFAGCRILHESREGRQQRIVFRGWSEQVQRQLERDANVLSFHRRNASLDEIFVAYTRGRSMGTEGEWKQSTSHNSAADGDIDPEIAGVA